MDKLKSAVTVKKEELKDVKQYTFPNGYSGTRVLFSGNEFALAASNIFNYNLEELIKRVGPDGFLHESSEENYNYSYDGFGTYSYSKKAAITISSTPETRQFFFSTITEKESLQRKSWIMQTTPLCTSNTTSCK